VSIGLPLDGREDLSRVTLVAAAAIWAALAVLLVLRVAWDPSAVRADVRTPGALTAPIATAVLGARLTLLGWAWAGIVALVLTSVLWLALLEPVLSGLRTPTVGVSLLVAVSAEALAVLAASLATPEHARWLLIAALVPFAVGLALYGIVISQFDLRQLVVGQGDHWITGGALGIAALAAAMLASGAHALGVLGGAEGALQDLALALWALTMLWLVVLLYVEARWPRLGYDLRRWSTVFPLGMYAACSFTVGAVTHTGAITSFAQVWVWVGVASWAILLAATSRRAVALVRGR
jgi:tellurite resistance protein TehA-like permease